MPRIDTPQGSVDFPDSMSTQDIEAALGRLYGPPGNSYEFGRIVRDQPRRPPEGPSATAQLATLGGLAGIPLGGPVGSVAGGALGAYLGRGIDRKAAGQSFVGPENEQEAMKAATLGTAGELGFGAANLAFSPMLRSRIAQRAMAAILNPGVKLLNKSPDLVENALREGIPLEEGMTMGGTKEVRNRLIGSHQLERDLANADPKNISVDPLEVLQAMRDKMNSGLPKNQTSRVEDSPEWQRLEQEFLGRFKSKTPAPEVSIAPPPRPSFSLPRPIGGPQPELRIGTPMSENTGWRTAGPEKSAAKMAQDQLLSRQVRGAAARVRPEGQPPPEHNAFDLEDLLAEKQRADKKILKVHKMRADRGEGKDVSTSLDTQEEFYDALADVLRNKIRATDPRLGAQMQKTSDYIAQSAAYLRAEAKPEKLVNNPAIASLQLLTGRGPTSRMALRMYAAGQRPVSPLGRVLPQLLRYGPRAAMLPGSRKDGNQ